MRLVLENCKENPVNLLRRAGYVFKERQGAEMSFVRELARGGYPRFHIYAKLSGADLQISLHLDQKRHTYGEGTRHHGEYEESPILEQEVARIKSSF